MHFRTGSYPYRTTGGGGLKSDWVVGFEFSRLRKQTYVRYGAYSTSMCKFGFSLVLCIYPVTETQHYENVCQTPAAYALQSAVV
jgi:hypothetical protein